MFSCEYCEIVKSTYFEDHRRSTASENIFEFNNKGAKVTSDTSSKLTIYTAQKMKFSIKNFVSKCDQIRSYLRIWSYLLRKSLMENFIFCAAMATRKHNSKIVVVLVFVLTILNKVHAMI